MNNKPEEAEERWSHVTFRAVPKNITPFADGILPYTLHHVFDGRARLAAITGLTD